MLNFIVFILILGWFVSVTQENSIFSFFQDGNSGTIVSERSLSKLFDITACPALDICTYMARSSEPSIYKLRPSDFKIIMGIGDSFTTGIVAKSGIWLNPLQWQEFPGITFSTGGDDGAVTLANFFRYYQPNRKPLIGISKGSRRLKTCLGVCDSEWIYIPEIDGLNSGVSGGKSSELEFQVEYLLSQLDKLLSEQTLVQPNERVRKDSWKFVTLFIGLNDICSNSCDKVFRDEENKVGHFKYYKIELIKALERLRKACPNTIVHIVQLFDISKYTKVVQSNPNCQHIDWIWSDYICPCAKTESGRNNVKKRIDKFNQVLEEVWNMYREGDNHVKYDDFAVILSPVLKSINFTVDFQTVFASQFDCTHPSFIGHAHLSVILWNQLFVPSNEKHKIEFSLPMDLYCPKATDFIQVV